jgi:hypothetical protein
MRASHSWFPHHPGTLCKKSGIWHLAENLQNNCLWFQKLRFYTPDHSIRKNREKSGPNYSW